MKSVDRWNPVCSFKGLICHSDLFGQPRLRSQGWLNKSEWQIRSPANHTDRIPSVYEECMQHTILQNIRTFWLPVPVLFWHHCHVLASHLSTDKHLPSDVCFCICKTQLSSALGLSLSILSVEDPTFLISKPWLKFSFFDSYGDWKSPSFTMSEFCKNLFAICSTKVH